MNTPATRTVRRATPDDAGTLARLRYLFRAHHHAPSESEDDFVPRCVAWMSPRLAPGSPWLAWILEEAGEPIGNLWMQLVEKIPNPADEPEHYAYVSNVFVVDGRRGSGGGTLLLDAALNECTRLDVDAAFLWATDASRPLYKRHGFTEPARVLVNQLFLE